MKITKQKTHTLINIEKSTAKEIVKGITNNKEFRNQHLIVNYSKKNNSNIEELLLFLPIAEQKKKNGTSFVLLCSEVEIDKIPETLNIVPTMREALDILEMEAIERDLGF